MDIAYAKKLLDIQIENARRVLIAGFGVNQAEAIFFDVIRLLLEESTLKPYFLKRVADTFAMPDVGSLDAGMVPGDLIELVAHELRWLEFQELANRRIKDFFRGDKSFAAGDIAYNIAEAYNDDWQDRMFYRRYTMLKGVNEK
jgi:hypothetical protein